MTKPDPAVVELARAILSETLHGKPPLESTMRLAEEVVRLDRAHRFAQEAIETAAVWEVVDADGLDEGP